MLRLNCKVGISCITASSTTDRDNMRLVGTKPIYRGDYCFFNEIVAIHVPITRIRYIEDVDTHTGAHMQVCCNRNFKNS